MCEFLHSGGHALSVANNGACGAQVPITTTANMMTSDMASMMTSDMAPLATDGSKKYYNIDLYIDSITWRFIFP